MRALTSKLGPISLSIAVLALPSGATAAYVPPDNSAATQYTEAVPTAGGPKKTGGSGHRQGGDPGTVLGKKNAKRLSSQGRAGQEAAQVAAATAPNAGAATESGDASRSGQAPEAAGQGSGPGSQGKSGQTTAKTSPSAEPDGSSALGEIASDATGSDSGGTGLLLPLAIAAAILGSIVYLLRQRRRQAS